MITRCFFYIGLSLERMENKGGNTKRLLSLADVSSPGYAMQNDSILNLKIEYVNYKTYIQRY